jgi:hypothetical protein
MTKSEIATLVESFGFPNAYYQFSEDTAQPPPFVCFYISGSYDFGADNLNYQAIRELIIELYTDEKDYAAEAVIETALQTAGIFYQTEETYIDSEQMYAVLFRATILFEIETEDDNG